MIMTCTNKSSGFFFYQGLSLPWLSDAFYYIPISLNGYIVHQPSQLSVIVDADLEELEGETRRQLLRTLRQAAATQLADKECILIRQLHVHAIRRNVQPEHV